jgi:hypothetical protein
MNLGLCHPWLFPDPCLQVVQSSREPHMQDSWSLLSSLHTNYQFLSTMEKCVSNYGNVSVRYSSNNKFCLREPGTVETWLERTFLMTICRSGISWFPRYTEYIYCARIIEHKYCASIVEFTINPISKRKIRNLSSFTLSFNYDSNRSRSLWLWRISIGSRYEEIVGSKSTHRLLKAERVSIDGFRTKFVPSEWL